VTFLAGQPSDFAISKSRHPKASTARPRSSAKPRLLAIEGNLKEERLKQALQELAELRAAEKALRASFAATAAEAPPDEVLAQASQAAATAAQQLRFSEDNTRKWLIDRDLRLAGWDVPAGMASNESVGQEVEVLHQPTATTKGYCDYVLWDDNGKPLAVVEAKKTSVDARQGQEQAQGCTPTAWKRCTASGP
jgi:type I restriction enzyme R subunit